MLAKKNNVSVANLQNIWSRYDVVDKKGTKLKQAESDGWHPNNLGHKLIAEAMYEKAYEILK
jgi:acyl-CoA thioesterase-1